MALWALEQKNESGYPLYCYDYYSNHGAKNALYDAWHMSLDIVRVGHLGIWAAPREGAVF